MNGGAGTLRHIPKELILTFYFFPSISKRNQINNIVCLCPNHHSQFDGFGFYIEAETFEIKGLEGYEGKKLTIKKEHNIDSDFFKYHHEQYKKHN